MESMKNTVKRGEFDTLASDVSDLKDRVSKCEVDIEALKEILANSKPSDNQKGSVGVSNSELILLRNRIEYVESTLTQLKKSFNDFKK